MSFLNDPNSILFWLVWAGLLIWQNYAFTEVSRARNSGSLKRHVKAALQSNGVWFLGQIMAVSAFMKIISGGYGWKKALFAIFFYTAFTMAGSVYAHYRSLKKEKGLDAVGGNKKFAQIPVEEWTEVKKLLAQAVTDSGDALNTVLIGLAGGREAQITYLKNVKAIPDTSETAAVAGCAGKAA